jgi:prepilin-type N-terminal cleavage/methylation domain-containing protein
MRYGSRRGLTLIEVLVAIAVLGATGTVVLTTLGATRDALRTALSAEVRTRRASQLLAVLALESNAALARREGRRQHGQYVVEVVRLKFDRWKIAVVDDSVREVVVETVVYRGEETTDER